MATSRVELVGKNTPAKAGDVRPRFDPWIRKIPWRREWQSILIFLPGDSHGQRSLAGYSPWGRQESDTAEWLAHTGESGRKFEEAGAHMTDLRWRMGERAKQGYWELLRRHNRTSWIGHFFDSTELDWQFSRCVHTLPELDPPWVLAHNADVHVPFQTIIGFLTEVWNTDLKQFSNFLTPQNHPGTGYSVDSWPSARSTSHHPQQSSGVCTVNERSRYFWWSVKFKNTELKFRCDGACLGILPVPYEFTKGIFIVLF